MRTSRQRHVRRRHHTMDARGLTVLYVGTMHDDDVAAERENAWCLCSIYAHAQQNAQIRPAGRLQRIGECDTRKASRTVMAAQTTI